MPVPSSRERRQDQPEALLSYIEKRIKQAVVSGELKPGAKLSPSAIAVDLGVSHIPVREALTSLAASGYLEHKPRVGFLVRVLSSDDLADIYHWREVLEREAFTMAIRGSPTTISRKCAGCAIRCGSWPRPASGVNT